MKHLSPAQIVDVADGCAAPAVSAHAAGCEACRARVESLREAARLASEDPLPEPSPLFWPHLAARIGRAVRREPAPAAAWRSWVWRLAPLGAAAALVTAVVMGPRLWIGAPGMARVVPAAPPAAPIEAAVASAADPAPADDPSWVLVSELSSQISVEEAEASGVLPPPGGTDRALLQLDDAERMELARILRDELAARAAGSPHGPGA